MNFDLLTHPCAESADLIDDVKCHNIHGSSYIKLFMLLISCFININKIIPSQMEVAPLHCTIDITQKRGLFKNTKEIEKM